MSLALLSRLATNQLSNAADIGAWQRPTTGKSYAAGWLLLVPLGASFALALGRFRSAGLRVSSQVFRMRRLREAPPVVWGRIWRRHGPNAQLVRRQTCAGSLWCADRAARAGRGLSTWLTGL